ncbi:hypothetical protein CAEBREN_26175 [Caenorhabditis brenneri]|uniref:ShKT domain-containing protein n=1 Tax=Caenorhabditis brenneri TaxID=135651 RepID=G0MU03_CAEBE|nr:hypothetical protein CAEBREN_26175 [Caenorhabditis brenneri]
MLVILTLVASLLTPEVTAVISGDFNCTVYNGTNFVYASSAVACENVLSDQYCAVAYIPASSWAGVPTERVPRLSCSTVTRSMCQSVTWRQILADDCPNVCGFCNLNGCIDAVVGCDADLSICNAIGMQEFVNQNCRRTCGRCSVTTPKPCSG